MEHLFLLCPWTTPLWSGLQIFPVPTNYNISSMNEDDLLIANTGGIKGENYSKTLFALWAIWKARNNKIFDENHPNPNEVLFSINSSFGEFQTSTLKPNLLVPELNRSIT